jgi:hypothetical protein
MAPIFAGLSCVALATPPTSSPASPARLGLGTGHPLEICPGVVAQRGACPRRVDALAMVRRAAGLDTAARSAPARPGTRDRAATRSLLAEPDTPDSVAAVRALARGRPGRAATGRATQDPVARRVAPGLGIHRLRAVLPGMALPSATAPVPPALAGQVEGHRGVLLVAPARARQVMVRLSEARAPAVPSATAPIQALAWRPGLPLAALARRVMALPSEARPRAVP